jgi:hypothetical protein
MLNHPQVLGFLDFKITSGMLEFFEKSEENLLFYLP